MGWQLMFWKRKPKKQYRSETYIVIKDLIEKGMLLMKDDLTDTDLQIWADTSLKIMEILMSKPYCYNPEILLHYIMLGIKLKQVDIEPHKKLNAYIQHLIGILNCF